MVGKNAGSSKTPPSAPERRAHADEAVATLIANDPGARARHYARIMALAWMTPATCLSVVFLALQATLPKDPPMYGSDSDGHLARLQVLDQPLRTSAYVRGWVSDSIVAALTLGFSTFGTDLERVHPNFSEAGWLSYTRSLRTSKVLDTVVNSRLDLTAVANGAVVDVSPDGGGEEANSAFEVPLLLTYRGGPGEQTQKTIATVHVVRVPTRQNPRGLAISSVEVK